MSYLNDGKKNYLLEIISILIYSCQNFGVFFEINSLYMINSSLVRMIVGQLLVIFLDLGLCILVYIKLCKEI